MDDIDVDAVVVGSGPAGVSAAWPMVHSGIDVVMIEAGNALPDVDPARPPLAAARGSLDDCARKRMLARGLRGGCQPQQLYFVEARSG